MFRILRIFKKKKERQIYLTGCHLSSVLFHANLRDFQLLNMLSIVNVVWTTLATVVSSGWGLRTVFYKVISNPDGNK